MIYIMKHRYYNNPVPEGYVELGIGDLFEYKDKDNINELNLYVNEVEGLYYIWKNCNDEIVGLNHYRRIFVNNGDYLKLEDAKEILKDYDMIITNDVVFQRSIYEQLKIEFENPDIYDKYYKKFCDAVPGLKEFFDKDRFNNREMFVCKRELMDKYCEWLFPIIMPIVQEFIQNDAEKVVNKRMISHIIERMFSFWIQKSNLKCYRMDYEDIPETIGSGKMIKVEVLEDFALGRYDELKNIQRKAREEKGKLFTGDIFECSEELADYLTKNNRLGRAFVKVIEIIPEKGKEIKEEKPKKHQQNLKKLLQKNSYYGNI